MLLAFFPSLVLALGEASRDPLGLGGLRLGLGLGLDFTREAAVHFRRVLLERQPEASKTGSALTLPRVIDGSEV